MIWRTLKWLVTRQPRTLMQVRDEARAGLSLDSNPDLGTEALDMSVVDAANRRNQSLERSSPLWSSWKNRILNSHNSSAQDFADDGYARRYHQLFQKNKEPRK